MTKEEWKIKLLSILENDYDIEELLMALSEIVNDERNKQKHPLVISCLDSVVSGIRQAALDYYVSTK